MNTLLNVSQLSVHYGSKVAVQTASLTVAPGECVALIGTNGAGKSSILKAIGGLHRPSSGAITFNGQDASRWSAAEAVRHGLILCPEGRQLFPQMSVMDNLLLGAFRRKAGKAELQASIDKLEDIFPVIRERRRQAAGTLSGGEQQMVALARALMSSPRLLMLDEPSLGLSPLLIERMFETVRQIVASGCSVLIAEQNVFSTLKTAHRAYVVDSGSIVHSSSAAELLDNQTVLLGLMGTSAPAGAA